MLNFMDGVGSPAPPFQLGGIMEKKKELTLEDLEGMEEAERDRYDTKAIIEAAKKKPKKKPEKKKK